jgi:hypothetical protein
MMHGCLLTELFKNDVIFQFSFCLRPMTENNLQGRRMNAILLEYEISKIYAGEIPCLCIYVCYGFLYENVYPVIF